MKRTGSALVTAMLVSIASADQGPIDYRQSVMDAIGGHTGAIAAILKRKVDRRQDLAVHARGIGELAPLVEHLFPADSREGKTHAKPAIWEQPQAFQRRVDNFEEAAARVAETVDGDFGIFVEAFQALGKSCKGCHDDFREQE